MARNHFNFWLDFNSDRLWKHHQLFFLIG
ncbi:hypothetical protein HFV01_24025 [Limnospira fusiformis SAG 85.79]|nr:hypothetical protein [Arthrospira platensis FACHB-971]QJB29670.1 hypothetical protein HFV01_24025 [Limnospira fusiformis SAG 85.79]QNH60122.1 MAG: hypothetical protein H2674_03195 [Limnospira indica BM01]